MIYLTDEYNIYPPPPSKKIAVLLKSFRFFYCALTIDSTPYVLVTLFLYIDLINRIWWIIDINNREIIGMKTGILVIIFDF